MEFQLLGKTLEISDARRMYVKIYADFEQMALEAGQHFNADIANELLEKYGDNGIDRYVRRYVVKTRDYLAKYGVYTLSDGTIWDKITEDNEGESFLQTVFDKNVAEIFERVPDDAPEEYGTLQLIESLKST